MLQCIKFKLIISRDVPVSLCCKRNSVAVSIYAEELRQLFCFVIFTIVNYSLQVSLKDIYKTIDIGAGEMVR